MDLKTSSSHFAKFSWQSSWMDGIYDMNSSPSPSQQHSLRNWEKPLVSGTTATAPQDSITSLTFSINSLYPPPCPAFSPVCHIQTYCSRHSRYRQRGTERKTLETLNWDELPLMTSLPTKGKQYILNYSYFKAVPFLYCFDPIKN